MASHPDLNAFPTLSIVLISDIRDSLERALECDDLDKAKEKIAGAIKPLEKLDEMASALSAQVGQSLGQ
jgi:hypothetical protein